MFKPLIRLAALALTGACATALFAQSEPLSDYDAEIAQIAAAPAVADALSRLEPIHEARLADLVTLTEIPAPPFGEEARGASFAEMIRATGFGEVSIDEVGNVIARRAGAGEGSLMVVAHLDTVFPPETDVSVAVQGNRYVAPGIGDDTRGLVMLLELASAIAGADIRTEADLVFIGNVGEEGPGDLRGTRHLFRDGANRPDSFIAIDGGNQSRLVTSAVGSNRYKVTFHGQGGHSWGDFGAANPHIASGRAIAHFAEAARPITLEGPRSSFSIGRVGGGTSVNSIPYESWFEVDMRSGNPGKIEALDAAFRAAVQQGLDEENAQRTVNEPLTVEIEPIGVRPAGEGDADWPLVQRAVAVLRSGGIEAQMSASSTDANVPISLGIPAITISRCGTSERAHSLDEFWVDDGTVAACTGRALLLIFAEAGFAG